MKKIHKTDTENKTATRLRMEAVRPKPESTETFPIKPKKGGGPRGRTASERRAQKRQVVKKSEEQHLKDRAKFYGTWSLYSLLSLGLVVSTSISGNWWLTVLILVQWCMFHKISMGHEVYRKDNG